MTFPRRPRDRRDGLFPTYINPQTILSPVTPMLDNLDTCLSRQRHPCFLIRFENFLVPSPPLTLKLQLTMTTESPRGAGSYSPGRSDEPCTPFPYTLFRESSVELEKAEPFAISEEEIASLAALDGGDPGEIGSLSHSVLSPELATPDGEIDAGLLLHSSLDLDLPEPHPALALQAVKIEEEVEDEEVVIIADHRDAATVWPSGALQAAADDVVRPMAGLGEAGPAPFLRKTYEMVSDPGTDPVVSWGSSHNSFVVWDQPEFSKQVLPQYFKHANFSSFIRQLNTYGFRKIDPDRWEFANQGFQKGKKQLLKNIKRRRKFSEHKKTSSSPIPSDYQKAKEEVELETLKKDQEALKAKILELKEERKKLQHEIYQVAKRVHNAECRNQQIFLFLTRAAKRPNFVQHLTPKRRQKREAETCESSKKRKLLGPDGEATECLLEVMDQKIQEPNLDCLRINDDSARIGSGTNKVLETVQMHNLSRPPTSGGDFRNVPGQTPSEMAGASMSDWPSVFHDMSEKLLGDDVVFGEDTEEDVEAGLTMDDTLVYLELEGLIDKSYGWSLEGVHK